VKKALFVITLFLLASCSTFKKDATKDNLFQDVSWIDLTYSFDSTTIYWPNNPTGFEHTTNAEGVTPLGYYYSSYSFCTPEHGGTHLDAPIHFAAQKRTVDEIPISSLTGSGILVDVSKKALLNRDYLITIEDVEAWEKINGTIADSSIIIFKTGYGKFYPNRKDYLGTDKRGQEAIPELHFPGMDPATTEWLVSKRKIKALGLDVASIDYGQSKDFKSHQILLANNSPGFENLANLDLLPAKGFYVVALPMKVGKGSGAPLRIIAGIKQ